MNKLQNQQASQGKHRTSVEKINTIKSLSDTTIYAPAFAVEPSEAIKMGPVQNWQIESESDNAKFVNDISTFIESMRIGMKAKEDDKRSSVSNKESVVQGGASAEIDENFELARNKAKDAEKYKAQINEPKGRSLVDNGLSDDDFFHVMCHVETGLKTKIENGEYMELEKLLPKNKQRTEGKMELINKNGATFFVPAETNAGKINGIRRWEQAFRVYAAIYSAANPHRAAEIWQYVYVINTAALSYTWENVATYDYTFRQLMAFNPGRSWSKTYTQGWNLCMRDPVNKLQNNNYAGRSTTGYNDNQGHGSNRNYAKAGGQKSDYCWDFNRVNGCNNNTVNG